ncbi:acetylxylan esterase [Limosilactobacillus difficilis]|uniref:acetylxylan esterase n=1 Tax=Limosilactobacillus difficilis TaxID=2991838 RepID=UPI0024BAB41D|nr:acetylxylan esterase [Limosilactobacillus difficilis]
MPADSMSIEQMKKYQGRRAVPKDFDAFWDHQLAQLPADAHAKLERRDFGLDTVNFYNLWFQGTNDARIHAKCVFPKTKDPFPVVFTFHGYMGQASDWVKLLEWPAANVGIVNLDTRGQQGQSEDNGVWGGSTVLGQIIRGVPEGRDHLFFKDVYLDVYTLINIVAAMDGVDSHRLYTWGGSQGGALSLVGAALNPKISKCVAQYPFLGDFKRTLEMGDRDLPYDEMFRYFKFHDPLHLTEEKFLSILDYIDVKNFAHRIKCPVLMLTGLEDDTVFPSTQFAIYNRIESEKHHLLLPEYGHEDMHYYAPSAIFNFLFGTKFPLGPTL